MLSLEELKCQKVAVEAAIELIEAQRIYSDAGQRVIRIQKLITDNCQHVKTTPMSHYSNGGYDYLSSITLWDQCNLCGKQLNTREDPNHMGCYA